MDYFELAKEFLQDMAMVYRTPHQKRINKALQGEAFILSDIALGDKKINPGEISQRADISTARVAATLKNLEKKGFITRTKDSAMRSRVIVEITEEGRQAAEEEQVNVIGNIAEMLEFLGEHDANEYLRIVKKLKRLNVTQQQHA